MALIIIGDIVARVGMDMEDRVKVARVVRGWVDAQPVPAVTGAMVLGDRGPDTDLYARLSETRRNHSSRFSYVKI